MEAIETNEREIFCPHCTEMLRVNWHALPPPTPSQNGTGWWLSCGHCQHRWWVPCPSSPEYQESLKKLKELLTAFDETAPDSPKSDARETVAPPPVPSVQVVPDEQQPSALASLLGVGEGKEADPFAAFQSLSFADWLENQKETAKNKKEEEDSSSHPEDKTRSSASGLVPDPSSFLTKSDLQDLKNSLLQAFRDELAQVTKAPALSSAKLRDPRNKEVLENRRGADFFPKKTTKRLSNSSAKGAEPSSVPLPDVVPSSVPIAASSTSGKKGRSFWLRFRQRLTLKPSADKSLVSWAEEAPYLAPVLPMVGTDDTKKKKSPPEECEGQVIPFRAKRVDSSFPDFPQSGRSRWLSLKKGARKKTEEHPDRTKGELVFPKEFRKEQAPFPSESDPQSLQNDLDRLLHGAERAHQKRKKKREFAAVSDMSLGQSEPALPRTSPTPSLDETESSADAEAPRGSLSAKMKLGLTLVGTGLVAVGALALTVRYKDAALSLWGKTVPSAASAEVPFSTDAPRPEPSEKASDPSPVLSSDAEQSAPKNQADRETFPSFNAEPNIEAPLETVPASKELTLEHVSYSLSKIPNVESSADGTLRCVVVTGEISNPTDAAASIPPISVTMTSTKWPGKLLYSGRYTHHVASLSPNGRSSFQIEKSLLMTDDEDLKIELAFAASDANVRAEGTESD